MSQKKEFHALPSRCLEESAIARMLDTILIGDSAAMVMMGETNTLAVSMEEMIYRNPRSDKGRTR